MQTFSIEAIELNPRALRDPKLIEITDGLVKKERSLLLIVLHHFREIERRRLFSDLKYKSLFDMLTSRYGYSERQAYSRINAMRVLKDLPQIEEKIQKGELNLTNLNLASSLFKQEKMPVSQKLEVLNQISNK